MIFNSFVVWSFTEETNSFFQDGAVEEIYGYTKEDFKNNNNLWYKVIIPEDRKSLNLVLKSIYGNRTYEKSVQYRILHKAGYVKNVVGIVKKEFKNGQIVYSGYLVDINQHQDALIADAYGDSLLMLLKDSIQKLYELNAERDTIIKSILEKLSGILGVDRVTLYENQSDENVGEKLTKAYKWEESEFHKKVSVNSFSDNLTLNKRLSRWYDCLVVQKCAVNEIIRLCPAEEKSLLAPMGIKSILVLPIWFNDKFFGIIQFDDYKYERYWDSETIKTLSLISRTIYASGEYEKSNEMAQTKIQDINELKVERDHFYKMLSHQLKNPLSTIDLNIGMLESVKKHLSGREEKLFVNKIDRIKRSVIKMKELIGAI